MITNLCRVYMFKPVLLMPLRVCVRACAYMFMSCLVWMRVCMCVFMCLYVMCVRACAGLVCVHMHAQSIAWAGLCVETMAIATTSNTSV